MAGIAAASQLPSGSDAPKLASCLQGRSKTAALCGTFTVPEDRAVLRGRTLSLRVVVIPARVRSRRAIVMVPGGPGSSAVDFAPAVADGRLSRELLALRDRYDLIFLDARGMGASKPFGCDFAPRARPETYFRQLWPVSLVADCWNRAVQSRDPSQYGTNAAVDDLDDLRSALGYGAIVLDGGSYGTFFSFVFLRRHPTRVESAVLDGVYAPHFIPMPGAPVAAQRALDDLARRCALDAVCAETFPHFAQHVHELLARFDAGPITVSLRRDGRDVPVKLSKEVFVDQFRQMLDSPANAAYLPAIVEAAWSEDYHPVADMVESVTQGLAHALDWGAFLSYTCAEEIPFVPAGDEARARRESFAQDLRLRAQRRACAHWPVHRMTPRFNAAVVSSVPVLMISGSDDPATPPAYAHAQLPFLRHGVSVVVRGAAHITETPCTDEIKARFIRNRSAADVRRSAPCTNAFSPPPFATAP